MYALILALCGLAVDLFYRRRHLGGRVPDDGPLLLVANHPNALIDPIVLARLAGRRVRTLAKEPLFRMPVLSWLVKGVGALPVYRAQDGADTTRNDATFRAVHEALANGDCVALFPEGISHHLPSLQPLKTGAARMALGAEAAYERATGRALGVRVVPVGLIYDDKGRFRSELFTQVGEPLLAREHVVGGDEQASVRALTAAIGEGIRALTLNLERWEDKPLVALAERVWPAGDGDGDDEDERARVARMRALADGARALKERDPVRYDALRERFARFARWLEDAGLVADDLQRGYSFASVGRFVARNLVALTLGLVVFASGALAYVVPYLLVDVIARLVKGTPDDVATKKVLAGLLSYPPWHALLTAALVWQVGVAAGLSLSLLLPLAGLYAEHFVRQRRRALTDTRSFFRVRESGVRQRLLLERDALQKELEEVASAL